MEPTTVFGYVIMGFTGIVSLYILISIIKEKVITRAKIKEFFRQIKEFLKSNKPKNKG